MGRKVIIRASYPADLVFFTRYLEAIRVDPKTTSKWKRDMSHHLQSIMGLLVSPDFEESIIESIESTDSIERKKGESK